MEIEIIIYRMQLKPNGINGMQLKPNGINLHSAILLACTEYANFKENSTKENAPQRWIAIKANSKMDNKLGGGGC